uniref:Uncharacterized protein n=1 Tax=Physcomitrium patens TaxID=3218 RepID=A0A2K1IYV8_PHYPA|nr:hypothetical protein PHYPA_024276 [Physcomitrium patens]
MTIWIISIKDIIYHITNFDDSIQVWKVLYNIFDNKNIACTILLLNQLYLIRMDKRSLVAKYLQKFSKLII